MLQFNWPVRQYVAIRNAKFVNKKLKTWNTHCTCKFWYRDRQRGIERLSLMINVDRDRDTWERKGKRNTCDRNLGGKRI